MNQELLKDLVDNIYPIEDYNKRLIAYKEWVWRVAASMSPPIGGAGNTLEVKRELERDFPFNDTRGENDIIFVGYLAEIFEKLQGDSEIYQIIINWRQSGISDHLILAKLQDVLKQLKTNTK